MSEGLLQRKDELTLSSWSIFIKSLPTGFAMLKAVLSHPRAAYKMFKMAEAAKKRAKHKEKERMELPYEIPVYHPEMRYSTSGEMYLRPTRLIESDAPEIIALAHQLGAFQKSEREYIESCFYFIRKYIRFSFAAPLVGAVETLRRGEAVCFDKAHLFIALCRVAGIPARMKTTNTAFTQQIYEGLTKENPIIKELYDSMGYFLMHTMAEVYIEGKWQIADVSIDDGYQAALGLPLSRFGENPHGVWNWEVSGGTLKFEELPFLFALSVMVALRLNRGLTLLIQEGWGEVLENGKKMLEEMGGEEEYDRKIRQTYKAILPEVSRKLFEAMEGQKEIVPVEREILGYDN